tara:strand:- start:6 stop:176 length:171 start_codon:yes stop_codon:yes gene_type:complete
MNTTALRHVRQLWSYDIAGRDLNRANQLKWVRAIRMLGNKWLLAQQIQRPVSKEKA